MHFGLEEQYRLREKGLPYMECVLMNGIVQKCSTKMFKIVQEAEFISFKLYNNESDDFWWYFMIVNDYQYMPMSLSSKIIVSQIISLSMRSYQTWWTYLHCSKWIVPMESIELGQSVHMVVYSVCIHAIPPHHVFIHSTLDTRRSISSYGCLYCTFPCHTTTPCLHPFNPWHP